ncbi:MAG: hypothetical protein Q8N26_20000 [Myxococcales bacterium]|nr:hypothetical protein [Myxococcales bacterium]
MKKLLFVLLAGLVLGFFVRNSPQFSVFRLQQALASGDLNVVMTYADLNAFAELPVDITVAMAAAGMKDAAGAVGETLVKIFGGAVGATVKQVGGQVAAQELRSRIEKRDLLSLLGGFAPKTGFGWYGGIQLVGVDAAILTIEGTCPSRELKGQSAETRMGIDLQRVKGPFLGFPSDWRAYGVEANSMKQLIKDCSFTF